MQNLPLSQHLSRLPPPVRPSTFPLPPGCWVVVFQEPVSGRTDVLLCLISWRSCLLCSSTLPKPFLRLKSYCLSTRRLRGLSTLNMPNLTSRWWDSWPCWSGAPLASSSLSFHGLLRCSRLCLLFLCFHFTLNSVHIFSPRVEQHIIDVRVLRDYDTCHDRVVYVSSVSLYLHLPQHKSCSQDYCVSLWGFLFFAWAPRSRSGSPVVPFRLLNEL